MPSPSTTSAPLRFVPHASAVEVGFWHILARRKLNEWKLARGTVTFQGERRSAHEPAAVAWTEVAALALEALDGDGAAADAASAAPPSLRPGHFSVRVALDNFNTIEEFREVDRVAAAGDAARAIVAACSDLARPVDETLLSGCMLHTFADIKKWRFVHWFCFPAVVPASPLTAPRAARAAEEYLGAHAAEVLAAAAEAHMADPREVFVVALARNGAAPRVLTVAEADAQLLLPDRTAPQPDAAARLGPGGDLLLAIADHSGLAGAAGSTLRNVAALAACRYGALHFAALCLRVDRAAAGEPARAARSIVVEVTVPEGAYAAGAFGGGGWETNGKGKPGPRMVDLGSQMDPVALAEGSVDLNLKLMRWRLMPSLDLEGVAAQRCLLLGSGTLGCNVARTLMSWGVRAITMVDNGRVSYSNPVRQSLFTHADCADGGRPKALAAAERLREIFPSMEANGVQLTIPMAGHSVGAPGSPQYAETARDHDMLRELIETHDIVFLLTDSRESRWLPTLIARDTCTPLINVALGFDSYVVMRHGVDGPGAEAGTSASVPSSSSEISSAAATSSSTPTSSTASSPSPPRAPDSLGTDRGHGCYFCNDCAAPLDSLSSRTLDQQCTVTRPGLSYVASANAVELMVTVLNHPDKWLAPAAEATPTTTRTEYPLGLAAQQLRGFLTHQHTAVVATVRSDRCTACSPAVVAAYRADRFGVVARACNEHDYLENLTGLTTLFAEADAAFAAIEAVSDDEDDW